MTLSELSVRRPVLMTMVYVLICVICVVFLPRLDMALYPDVDLPVISVMVSCNDAGPEEIELQVTDTMEDSLNSLQNLDTMTSISREGMAMVILEFNYGTNLDDAYDDVTFEPKLTHPDEGKSSKISTCTLPHPLDLQIENQV